MNFQDLNLPNALLRALRDKEYERPTPIQMQAIPAALEGRDILGTAQTGTGKTAAFALPVLANLLRRPPVGRGRPIRTLILTPTRELALQIDESLGDYAKYTPLRTCVVFGGVNQRPQIDCLKRGVDVLTATPGRLLDLIGQGHISLKQIEFFVLDGADRIARIVSKAGIGCDAIHGDKSQTARQRALSNFKAGKTRVIVATDIAARGIDIDQLEMVINYDLPDVAETYVHRIGRTGRAGHSGMALTFCASDERPMLADIQKLTGKKLRVITG